MLKSAIISGFIVVLMWLSFLLDFIFPGEFASFGILPRHLDGLWGIIFAPFIHGGLSHIVSNTGGIFVLTLVLFWMYREIAWKIWIQSALLDGLLVWLFARSSYHIGMSGVIFALLGFLLSIGLFRRSLKTIIISLVIFFIYGGVVWGVLPSNPSISWEAHLFGFIVGIGLAYRNRELV